MNFKTWTLALALTFLTVLPNVSFADNCNFNQSCDFKAAQSTGTTTMSFVGVTNDCYYRYYSGLYPAGATTTAVGSYAGSCSTTFVPLTDSISTTSQGFLSGYNYYVFYDSSNSYGYYYPFYIYNDGTVRPLNSPTTTPQQIIRLVVSPSYNSLQTTSELSYDATTDGSFYIGATISVTNMDTNEIFEWSDYFVGNYATTTRPNLGNGLYNGTVCLIPDYEVTTSITCEQVLFTVNTTSVSLSNFNTTATSSVGMAGKLLEYLYSVIRSKFPFNWFFETVTIIKGLVTRTATTTIPSVTVDYSGLHTLQNIPTTTAQNLTFTFFSAATFNTVAAIPGIQQMRTLAGYVLWIGFMFMSFRRIGAYFGDKDQVRTDSWRGHQI